MYSLPTLLFLKLETPAADLHPTHSPAAFSHQWNEFGAHWAPSWEVAGGGLYLDLSGTDRLLGRGPRGALRVCRDARRHWDSMSGGLPSICGGLGRGALVAFLAGRMAASEPHCMLEVPAGNESAFLEPFSVAVLSGRFPREVARLQHLGVRTLGDLQATSRALLEATFGTVGATLFEAAHGRLPVVLRPDRHRAPQETVVAAARWSRPLAGDGPERALRRALARRAMLACAGGPGEWHPWRLRGSWAGGGTSDANATGGEHDTWDDWLALVDRLWGRLPRRRRGLIGVQLRAGRRQVSRDQPLLFPDPGLEQRGSLARGWRGLGEGVQLASEALLVAWDLQWSSGNST